VIHFAVDGGAVHPRRQVVSVELCNACHFRLSLHGGSRNATGQCVLCHNPTQTDADERPPSAAPATAIDFRMLIHQIHTGRDLEYNYTVYGRNGTPHNYNEVGYPGDRRNCAACHVNGSEQLPLAATLIPVNNPNGLLNPVAPASAACTSCHTSVDAASHALINTSALGESCAVCHGPDASFSVSSSHAR
jgi:OmcA/MtrC family decaheme c-type cytochrome